MEDNKTQLTQSKQLEEIVKSTNDQNKEVVEEIKVLTQKMDEVAKRAATQDYGNMRAEIKA